MDKLIQTIMDDLSKLTPAYVAATGPLTRLVLRIGPITKDAKNRYRTLDLECGHSIQQSAPLGTRMPQASAGPPVECPHCTSPSFSFDGYYALDRWVYGLLLTAARRRCAPWTGFVAAAQGARLPEIWAALTPLLDDSYPTVDALIELAQDFVRGQDETTARQLVRIRKRLPELVALVLSDPFSRTPLEPPC